MALVTLENTHMEAGGTIWPLEAMQAIVDTAGDLGIATFGDLGGRVAQVESLLPRVSEVAEAIMAENQEIEG